MEENGQYLGAYEAYKSAIKLDKKNSLVKMMNAYFCNRMREFKSAVKALK